MIEVPIDRPSRLLFSGCLGCLLAPKCLVHRNGREEISQLVLTLHPAKNAVARLNQQSDERMPTTRVRGTPCARALQGIKTNIPNLSMIGRKAWLKGRKSRHLYIR